MDVTEHRSADGVQQYKKVSLEQCKTLAGVIQNPNKKTKYKTQESKPDGAACAAVQDAQKSFSFSGNIQSLVINI